MHDRFGGLANGAAFETKSDLHALPAADHQTGGLHRAEVVTKRRDAEPGLFEKRIEAETVRAGVVEDGEKRDAPRMRERGHGAGDGVGLVHGVTVNDPSQRLLNRASGI